MNLQSLSFAILPVEGLARILPFALSAGLMPFTHVYEHVKTICANTDLISTPRGVLSVLQAPG